MDGLTFSFSPAEEEDDKVKKRKMNSMRRRFFKGKAIGS
jgi:hypothetical protein